MIDLFSVELAGVRLPCVLQFPENVKRLSALPLERNCIGDPISIPEQHWEYYHSIGVTQSPEGEYTVICCYFSDALMEFDRMLFHGVAIRWQDKAYLISAPSGVGKSTQAKHLQALRPGEFSVICGDRPVLQFCPSGNAPASGTEPTVIVHPSYWNGKEGWHGAEAAPLAGIIVLERGEKNSICALSPREAAISVYLQAFQSFARADIAKRTAELVTQMLESVPIWRLTTYEVPASTKLLLETVFSSPES